MPKIQDYECRCGERFEFMHMAGEPAACPKCNDTNVLLLVHGGKPLSTIIPMSRSSLKHKAGYVHTHADRPAEKGSVAVPSNKGNF